METTTQSPARPIVTADIVLFKSFPDGVRVLLIQRKKPPYQGYWALPGGKLNTGETIEEAAFRELAEETAIRGLSLHQFAVFSQPDRDPRGHYMSIAFYSVVASSLEAYAGDDACASAWMWTHELPPLAFDHEQIILEALGQAVLDGTLYR